MAKKAQSESLIDMFARLGRDLHMPDLDVASVIEHNRRNLEAFERSARAAGAGASKLLERQREMLQEALGDIKDMSAHLRAGGDPQEFVSKQAEFARKGFETAVRNTGEVADLVARSSGEALDILRNRIKEGLEEIRQGVEKRK